MLDSTVHTHIPTQFVLKLLLAVTTIWSFSRNLYDTLSWNITDIALMSLTAIHPSPIATDRQWPITIPSISSEAAICILYANS